MKRFTLLLFLIVVLALAIPGAAASAQDGLTVTVPGGDDTIPPVTWDPDNWILIITVGFVIAFGVLGGTVAFLGNKLYLSIPQWAQPGVEQTTRQGLTEALDRGRAIVIQTPSTLDDKMFEVIEAKINEIANRIFLEAKG